MSTTEPWYRRLRWEPSLSVALLLFLLIITALSATPLLPKTVAITGIAAFMACYLYLANTMPPWPRPGTPGGPTDQLKALIGPMTMLAASAALTAPVLGWWTVFFLPYLCALLLFTTRLGTGLVATGALVASTLTATGILAQGAEVRWMALGCSASTFAVAGARIGEELSERWRITRNELAAAAEREEIARDVHDLLGHSLTVLTLKAEVAQRLIAADPDRARAELDEIIELSRTALGDVRSTVSRLRTPNLANQVRASQTALATAGLQVDFCGQVTSIPLPQREILAWALREATTNIIRHAAASTVTIKLAPGSLQVIDNGVGIGGSPLGNGLRGLAERIAGAGGELHLGGAPAGSSPAGNTPGTMLEVLL